MLNPEQLLEAVRLQLEELKAQDVTVLDVRGKTALTDYMVIASGSSTRHLKTLAEGAVKVARDSGQSGANVEGDSGCEWVLVDLADIILHLFLPRTRDFYDLEKLWSVPTRSANSERAIAT